MNNTIYLSFSDLNEDTQQEIMGKAIRKIENDTEQMNEIKETWGDSAPEIIMERAERELYSFDYVFNV